MDNPTLLSILSHDYKIVGTPLDWFESCLTGWSMRVLVNNRTSKSINVNYGVPQGSCAGPVVFNLYIAALNKVVRKYSPELYGYADDHKLAMTFSAGNSDVEASIKSEVETCLQNIIRWMTENKLKINSTKTEIIVYGSKRNNSSPKMVLISFQWVVLM